MTDKSTGTVARLWFPVLIGTVGGLAGFAAAFVLRHGGATLRWSDGLALVVAVVMLVMGVPYLLAGRVDGLARTLTRTESGPVPETTRRQLAPQGVTLVLAGLLLAAPPFLAPWVAQDRPLAVGLFVAVAGVFALQSLINIRLWRFADEFYRRAMLEASAVSFWVLQGGLFLWAVAERLDIVPALQAWDFVAVLMSVYLVLSSIVARRLGTG